MMRDHTNKGKPKSRYFTVIPDRDTHTTSSGYESHVPAQCMGLFRPDELSISLVQSDRTSAVGSPNRDMAL